MQAYFESTAKKNSFTDSYTANARTLSLLTNNGEQLKIKMKQQRQQKEIVVTVQFSRIINYTQNGLKIIFGRVFSPLKISKVSMDKKRQTQ